MRGVLCFGLFLSWVLWGAWANARGEGVRHRLLEGSVFIDDCPPCGRPIVPLRLRGTFDLLLDREDPLFRYYRLTNIDWITSTWGEAPIRITGQGSWVVGGEVAWTQRVMLDVECWMGTNRIRRHFTNDSPVALRALPNLGSDLTAVESTWTQVFRLSLRSAPFRELWFVTDHGFTPGNVPAGGYHPAGDVLSMDGRVILANTRLTSRLGLMPIVPPLGVDALKVLPGGRMLFSLRDRQFSEVLGELPSGALLTSDGTVYRMPVDLLKPFHPVSSLEDPGLDAVQVLEDGTLLFSTVSDVRTTAGILSHGDVLDGRGGVRHGLKSLLAAFDPIWEPGSDPGQVGLDAVHEWPHGEVWFSVVRGFQSRVVGPVRGGDVLSDRGWIVYRNLELMEGFQPIEDLADFGLGDFWVLTDGEGPAETVGLRLPVAAEGVELEWSGTGRVWQVESSVRLEGPYRPAGPVQVETNWTGKVGAGAEYFRVRAW